MSKTHLPIPHGYSEEADSSPASRRLFGFPLTNIAMSFSVASQRLSSGGHFHDELQAKYYTLVD